MYKSTPNSIVCEDCGISVRPDSPSTYRRVSGWEHPRDGGGTNAIHLREVEDRYRCYVCMNKARRGIPIGQGSIL